ncbi:MAG: FMN-binding glutamate synthase family protein [Bacillota bacterium]
MWQILLYVVAGVVIMTIIICALAYFLGRFMVDCLIAYMGKVMMTDKYTENVLELFTAVTRFGPQQIAELNLRAERGKPLLRPLGTPKRMADVDSLMFDFAQLHRLPTPLETHIDMQTVLGPKAKRPLVLDMPVMIAGMAYGVALSEGAKVALAKGAAMAGTAANTGEGPFLESERNAAKYLILQYNRGDWAKDESILKRADAIEIQIGQGAYGGIGHVFRAEQMDDTLREAFDYPKGRDAVAHSQQPDVDDPRKLKDLVSRLRKITDGVPIGVKIAAGRHLEQDMEWCIKAGVDFITVGPAQGASRGSPPILQDDFGIPNVYAIHRAARYLERRRVRDRITLVVGGRLRTPGDYLKALALGADICGIGSPALFAISHTQVLKPIPFEPPTQLVWYDGKFAKDFDVEKGAQSLYKYLDSCKLEMGEGVRALGKSSIHEVSREDLMSLDETIARVLDLPMVYEPGKD